MQEIEELRASRGAAGGDSGVATESANVDSITVEKVFVVLCLRC